MNTVTAAPAVVAALSALDETVELRDSSGQLLGVFTPASVQSRRLYQAARQHFSPEELRQRKEAGGEGVSTEELLRRLDTLKES